MQQRLDSARTNLQGRATTVQGLVGDITDVNLPEAISQLQAAQVSVQAAAQAFKSLQGSSLLAILNP